MIFHLQLLVETLPNKLLLPKSNKYDCIHIYHNVIIKRLLSSNYKKIKADDNILSYFRLETMILIILSFLELKCLPFPLCWSFQCQ